MKILACAAALLAVVPVFAEPGRTTVCNGGVIVCYGRATRKVDSIIIPRIDLRNVTVTEAFEFLRVKSKQLDPEGVGINIVLKLPAEPTPTFTPKAVPAKPR